MASYSNPGINGTDTPSSLTPGQTTERADVAPKVKLDAAPNWQTHKVSADLIKPSPGMRNRSADPIAKVPSKLSRS